jgi:hypothetical protein
LVIGREFDMNRGEMFRSHRASRAALAGLLAASVVLTPARGAAEPASGTPAERAEARFLEGRALMDRGQLVEACNKFAESADLVRMGRTVLNLAECYERRGMLASAYAKFLEAAQIAVTAKRADAERHARERAALLEPRLGRIAIVVPKKSDVPDLVVRYDGRVLDRSLWNVGEIADPGSVHTIEATGNGKTFTKTVSAEDHGTILVTVELGAPDPAPPPVPSPPPAPATPVAPRAEDGSGTGTRVVGIGALALGVVGLGVGVYSTVKILDARQTVDAHCDPATKLCDEEGIDATSVGKTHSIVAPIAYGVGALATVAGLYLLLRKNDPKQAMLLPRIGTGGGGVSFQASF